MGNGIEAPMATIAGTAVQASAAGVRTGPSSGAVALRVPIGALVRMTAGARWFYWIAGLSLVNTLMASAAARLHFVLGLGITQFVDTIAKKSGPAATAPALIIDIMIAVAFVLIGMWASRCNQFAFGMGMLLYAADGTLLVVSHSWLAVAVHVLALCYIYRGFSAAQQLRGIADLGHNGA